MDFKLDGNYCIQHSNIFIIGICTLDSEIQQILGISAQKKTENIPCQTIPLFQEIWITACNGIIRILDRSSEIAMCSKHVAKNSKIN